MQYFTKTTPPTQPKKIYYFTEDQLLKKDALVNENDLLSLENRLKREESFNNLISSIEDKVVIELNEKHAVIHIDQFHILTEKPHGFFSGIDFSLETKNSLINTYENQMVMCSDGKLRNKARIWLASPNRRQYEGITFDPGIVGHSDKLYNIWKGFSIEPKKGSCELYKAHVKNIICSGNPAYFNYLWKWLAKLVQQPDEVSTAIVLTGLQGTGKNSFVEPIGRLFGAHFLPLDNIHQLVGQFNFHLKNAVLIHANEAMWGGNLKDLGVLKAMITDPFSVIEGKGKDRVIVRNYKHLIISSNDSWPVHIDHDDRRFLVLRLCDSKKEDTNYFKNIKNEIENGGLEALLYELLNEDVESFDHRAIPLNVEAFHVKIISSNSVQEYIYEALKKGCFDLANNNQFSPWRETILLQSVYKDYEMWCEQKKYKSQKSTQFGMEINKIIPSLKKTKPRPESESKRLEYYNFLSLEKTREDFQKSFKVDDSIW